MNVLCIILFIEEKVYTNLTLRRRFLTITVARITIRLQCDLGYKSSHESMCIIVVIVLNTIFRISNYLSFKLFQTR